MSSDQGKARLAEAETELREGDALAFLVTEDAVTAFRDAFGRPCPPAPGSRS
jgi:hypothetical protein